MSNDDHLRHIQEEGIKHDLRGQVRERGHHPISNTAAYDGPPDWRETPSKMDALTEAVDKAGVYDTAPTSVPLSATPIEGIVSWMSKRLSETHDNATTLSMLRRKLEDLPRRELAASRAECERYNQQLADKSIYASQLEQERAQLRAENAKLRDALKFIGENAGEIVHTELGTISCSAAWAKEQCRSALFEKGGGE